jgi:hypothetical protein
MFLLLSISFSHADGYLITDIDIDRDGVSDNIEFYKPDSVSEDYFEDVTVNIKISLTATKVVYERAFRVSVEVVSDLHVVSWGQKPGYIFLDYTNRTTRGSTEFHSEVYRWNNDKHKMCLYANAYGVTRNQLKNELFAKEKNIRIYNNCYEIGEYSSDADIPDYWDNNKVTIAIQTEKAWLYNSANTNSRTNTYLIKNDKVLIKDYKYLHGNDWFLIEYNPPAKSNPVIKWVQAHSVGIELTE